MNEAMLRTNRKMKKNRGMTYVELIVVLSIFSVMASVVLFNYGDFQAKVDIKNLSSDIALQAVEAQKLSIAGDLPPLTQQTLIGSPSTWKPAYGVFFNLAKNTRFIFFTDVNGDTLYDRLGCSVVGECLTQIDITKNNTISSLDVFYRGDPSPHAITDLTVTFKRPDSRAILNSTPALSGSQTVDYVQITVSSPKNISSLIKVYPSGRIQVN